MAFGSVKRLINLVAPAALFVAAFLPGNKAAAAETTNHVKTPAHVKIDPKACVGEIWTTGTGESKTTRFVGCQRADGFFTVWTSNEKNLKPVAGGASLILTAKGHLVSGAKNTKAGSIDFKADDTNVLFTEHAHSPNHKRLDVDALQNGFMADIGQMVFLVQHGSGQPLDRIYYAQGNVKTDVVYPKPVKHHAPVAAPATATPSAPAAATPPAPSADAATPAETNSPTPPAASTQTTVAAPAAPADNAAVDPKDQMIAGLKAKIEREEQANAQLQQTIDRQNDDIQNDHNDIARLQDMLKKATTPPETTTAAPTATPSHAAPAVAPASADEAQPAVPTEAPKKSEATPTPASPTSASLASGQFMDLTLLRPASDAEISIKSATVTQMAISPREQVQNQWNAAKAIFRPRSKLSLAARTANDVEMTRALNALAETATAQLKAGNGDIDQLARVVIYLNRKNAEFARNKWNKFDIKNMRDLNEQMQKNAGFVTDPKLAHSAYNYALSYQNADAKAQARAAKADRPQRAPDFGPAYIQTPHMGA